MIILTNLITGLESLFQRIVISTHYLQPMTHSFRLYCSFRTDKLSLIMKPKVAIVGRPNVGKSTLFNRIIGKRKAIVHDEPGVTRDRNYEDSEWNGIPFTLIDTGGYFPKGPDQFSDYIAENVEDAISEADCLLIIFDGREGLIASDWETFEFLKKMGKPLIVAANKIDNVSQESLTSEFYQLGIEDIYPISAIHGHGTGDLLDAIVETLPKIPPEDKTVSDTIKITLVGRPNVGKSTLLNKILGQERSLVSDIPGTTRDPVDGVFTVDDKRYEILDLAGIRRRGKIQPGVEKYAFVRTQKAIEECDIALLMIDAVEGVTETDAHVFSLADEAYKPSVIIVNKWDLIEKDTYTAIKFEKKLREKLAFLKYAQVIFISSLTGQRVLKIFPLINKIFEGYSQRVSTGSLNKFIEQIQAHKPVPNHKGKMYYITQVGIKPPTFVLFVNKIEFIHFSYQRYIKNQLYYHFGFEGTPLKLILKQRVSKYHESDYKLIEQRNR